MALADNVQLHSYDGSLSMTGELLGYDGTGFEIKTSVGVVLVASSLVTCDGAACPAVEDVEADLRAAGFEFPKIDGTNSDGLSLKPEYCPHAAIGLDIHS